MYSNHSSSKNLYLCRKPTHAVRHYEQNPCQHTPHTSGPWSRHCRLLGPCPVRTHPDSCMDTHWRGNHTGHSHSPALPEMVNPYYNHPTGCQPYLPPLLHRKHRLHAVPDGQLLFAQQGSFERTGHRHTQQTFRNKRTAQPHRQAPLSDQPRAKILHRGNLCKRPHQDAERIFQHLPRHSTRHAHSLLGKRLLRIPCPAGHFLREILSEKVSLLTAP